MKKFLIAALAAGAVYNVITCALRAKEVIAASNDPAMKSDIEEGNFTDIEE